ncbi:MAG: phosphate acetyltransferase [Deltaproteobacteria bacterium]|nr:phosphate acetyltransferase [Deltaproteobacteria bacterium]
MATKAIFIHPRETRCGCRIVTLGMMSFLQRRIKKVAFFKPVCQPAGDDDIAFFQGYFHLEQSPATAVGVDLETARRHLLAGRLDELLGTVMARYKKLEEEYEFVLCQGQHQAVFASLGFDLNLEIAASLGLPVVPVLSGKERRGEEILDEVRILRKTMNDRGCAIFALFVNRLDPAGLAPLARQAAALELPVFLLPENAELNRPTMADVARQLGAVLLAGDRTQLDRTIRQSKVAAMTLKNYLSRLEDGDLVIVPGDREEIYLGTQLANVAKSFPAVAGILLTGGLRPDPLVMKLAQSLGLPLLPLLGLEADTEEAAGRVREVKPTLSLESTRKISLAMGIFHDHVDFAVLESRVASSTVDYLTPVMFEHLLYEQAKSSCRHILLPEGEDERILRAAEIALRRGIASITILGDPEEIKRKSDIWGLDLGDATIVDPRHSPYMEEFVEKFYQLRREKGVIREIAREMMTRRSYFATMMLHCGYVDGVVSGATHTTRETVLPALKIIKTPPGVKLVSSVFFMFLQSRVLVFGDCAINPDPDAEELAQIAISSAGTAAAFGIEPKVAMLSYASGSSGVGRDVDKVKEATALVRARRPDLLVEGPIQYDAAIDPEVARIKMPGSPVAGRATVFIFPELNTGNNTYKAVQRAAKSLAIGPVLQGLRKPVNDLSRGCSVGDAVFTIAITSIQAGEGR